MEDGGIKNQSDDDISIPSSVHKRKKKQLGRSFTSFQFPTTALSTNNKCKTSPSLLLNERLSQSANRRTSMPEYKETTYSSDDRCMEYGTPPPIEEPHCYSICMSDSSILDENSVAIQVNKDYVKNLLINHTKTLGCRLHILEDLESEKIDCKMPQRYLKTCKKPQELNALLLYASFLGYAELLSVLYSYGADLNHMEPELGMTALHLCAFSNCIAGVQYLINNSVQINNKKPLTPYHFAAFGNALDVAKYFFYLGWSQESPLGEETVLHAAARHFAIEVLQFLAPKNSTINRLDSCGQAAIHYVVDRNDSTCLQILISAGCLVNILTRKGDSPLHLAAEAGSVKNLELLLNNGANVALKNKRGQTALHIAARTHSLECVEALLQHAGSDLNLEDLDGRTALHMALGRSLLAYDVAEMLINWKAEVNKADKYGHTPLHVAALNELSQCVDILIESGADLSAKTKGGTTALSIILRKTPSSLKCFEQRLDASVSLHQHGSAAGEVELRLDFHSLLQHKQQGEIGYLGTFVKEGYKEILKHPLCQSFLHLKWQKIRKYYVGRLLFYLMYVLVLTAWVITALAHNCYNESHGQLDNSSRPLCANSTGLNGFLYKHPVVLEVEWYALVVLSVLEAVRKLLGILTYSSIKQFFIQPENIVEWCVIVSVFATSFVFTGRTYTWQSHVGAFAVLCGWSNLMLMIGQLPMFGAYVAMFTSVQAQVFKLLLAYACLLVGFTASFCVIFPRSKSFSSPHTGLIKVLVMMTGELDFEELFFPGEEEAIRPVEVGGTSWILLQISAQLSFVLFLLFVTIVLMNLLVGIAVHDIKGLQKTAGLAKLVRQTKLICDLETALFLGLLPQCLMKILRWTALVLPSPLKVVLTVRPLNPREKRLPSEVLASAYQIAKQRKKINNISPDNNVRKNETYVYQRFELNSSMNHVEINESCEDLVALEAIRLNDEVAELKKLCENNNMLINELIKTFSLSK